MSSCYIRILNLCGTVYLYFLYSSVRVWKHWDANCICWNVCMLWIAFQQTSGEWSRKHWPPQRWLYSDVFLYILCISCCTSLMPHLELMDFVLNTFQPFSPLLLNASLTFAPHFHLSLFCLRPKPSHLMNYVCTMIYTQSRVQYSRYCHCMFIEHLL